MEDKVEFQEVKPTVIKIGYKRYTIVRQPELFDNKHQELYGEVDYDEEKIRIATRFSSNVQNQSLIHELVHSISDKYQLDINKDERTVDLLAAGIYELILDNKETVKAFVEGVKDNE